MFFSRKHKITKNAYGKVILSKFILNSGENYFDLMKEFDLELDFANYLFYLQYLLYVAHKILRLKYSLSDTSVIVNSSIDGIIDLLDDIDFNSKPQLKETFRKCYWDFFNDNDINIFVENDMHKLADLFLETEKILKFIIPFL